MYYARNIFKNRHNCIYLFENSRKLDFIVFDVESTGLNFEKDQIVELAAIKYRVASGELQKIDELDLFIRPRKPMSQKIIDIHGITNEFLYDKPTEDMVMGRVCKFFGDNPILVGHNIEFDIHMLSNMYKRNNRRLKPMVLFDTLEMARDVVSHNEIKDYKLSSLAKIYGLDSGLTFHHAIDDVIATGRLLLCLYHEYKKLPIITNGEKLHINYIYFWKGYKKEQSGVYVDTNAGRVYFSTVNKTWASMEVNFSKIDLDDFEKQLLIRTNLKSMKEIGKMTEKKFNELKASRKKEGVYL